MKNLFFTLFLFTSLVALAQKPCEIDTNVTDSLGTYKLTKQHMIFERSFAGNSTNIFFALSSNNGVLGLETQQLSSSFDFVKAVCFDKNSKIYLQLNNGKIITLLYVGNDIKRSARIGLSLRIPISVIARRESLKRSAALMARPAKIVVFFTGS